MVGITQLCWELTGFGCSGLGTPWQSCRGNLVSVRNRVEAGLWSDLKSPGVSGTYSALFLGELARGVQYREVKETGRMAVVTSWLRVGGVSAEGLEAAVEFRAEFDALPAAKGVALVKSATSMLTSSGVQCTATVLKALAAAYSAEWYAMPGAELAVQVLNNAAEALALIEGEEA